MPQIAEALLYALLAGAMIPLGGILAQRENIRPNWLEQEFRHSVIAFGGGVLLAAIAFVLVPGGTEDLPVWASMAAMAAGGIAFARLDHWIANRLGKAGQLVAMLADFLPEAVALGALFAAGSEAAPLLALMIGLQNLPEGFNAYRELAAAGHHGPRRVLTVFLACAGLGPLAALAGMAWLAAAPAVTGALMLFAAGGLLYLIFEDIAPQTPLERRWAPPLGAVAGFMAGLLGHLLLGVQ
ncbi:ZIP family metal transporter [Rhodovulum sp. YNF3179]|uniref:ZIP family metal transporter n=1 Tax=Rhodovulum sp. YNF3179 TaxID=3425127 RepID=UPI003D32BA21